MNDYTFFNLRTLCTSLAIFWGGLQLAYAQKPTSPQLFTPQQLIDIVKKNHPVAKQASILVEKAKAELLSAKGAFDPVFEMDASRKTFDGKNYYFYTNPQLKLPTPIGVDVKTGLENNGGQFVTSEASKGQTSYLGLEMALLKGVTIDKRRAALQQAKIFNKQSEQEKLNVLNNLFFDAYADYWQWAGAYQLYTVYSKFVQTAQNRLRLIRVSFKNGDRSVVDTVEAYTQLQNFQLQQAEALLKLNNASLELSNHLWQQNDSAYLLPQTAIPDTIQFAFTEKISNTDAQIAQAALQNPIIKSYQYKLDALEVEKRLKFQSLLPYVTLKANILNKGYNTLKAVDIPFIENNYKWGLDIKVPLLLREGRGDYQKAKLKIKETALEIDNKQWQIENKMRYYLNENNYLQQQLKITQSMFNNYSTLLRNEELRFAQGESSLFLINSREMKVIESLQKQIELRTKYQKARFAIDWAAGLLQ